MVVVDTSVWIDFFNDVSTPQVQLLRGLAGQRPIAVGDLILAELLQGFASESEATAALAYLEAFDVLDMAGRAVAVESAANFRRLRQRGVTVRKTIDMLIGTFCMMHGHELLYADRDFDALARHLGLRVVS